jgi:hypothetical protein
MVELFFTILFLILLLLCAIGAVYFFYRAIRLFIIKKIWEGAVRLLLSLLLGFIVFFVISAVIGAREKALRCSCAGHLGNIVLMLKMYANDHQEAYPSTLNGLSGDYLKTGDKAILVCPASHTKAGSLSNIHEWTDFAYVSGLSEADHSGCVVAFCLPENHKGEGASVAFIGGNVQWYSCNSYTNPSTGERNVTFHDLTNNPSFFYGTTNLTKLVELMSRTKIIYPKHRK